MTEGQPHSPPPAAPPQGGPSAPPWYRTRFAYGLGAVLAVLLVIGALTSPSEEAAVAPVEEPEIELAAEPEAAADPEPVAEPEPAVMVEVPDFRGAYVAALEAAEEAGLEILPVDEVGERQSIFNRENWEVETQSVEPDQQVEAGTEIEVTVYRPLDREREQRQAELEEERQQRQTEREEERRQAQAQRDQARRQQETESRERSAELIALVEQHYTWFAEDKVSMDEDYQLWLAQHAVEQVEGFRMVGPFFLVESGLHKDNPDSAGIAESLCNVASAALYEQGVERVEVEATNGNVIARCRPID
jgi:hypothetical protein